MKMTMSEFTYYYIDQDTNQLLLFLYSQQVHNIDHNRKLLVELVVLVLQSKKEKNTFMVKNDRV